MKKLILILAAALAALATPSCTATFHASHRHPVPPLARVDVRVAHRPVPPRRHRPDIKRHRRPQAKPLYGMRAERPVPPRRPASRR